MRGNVDISFGDFQLPGLFVPLFLVPGELKLMRKKKWVLSAVRMALQAMRCKPARACASPQVELWKTWGMGRFRQCKENLS